MPSIKAGGGQRRILGCSCGWTNKGHPSRQDVAYRLHRKICKIDEFVKPSDRLFTPDMNGMNGVKINKRGQEIQHSVKAEICFPN